MAFPTYPLPGYVPPSSNSSYGWLPPSTDVTYQALTNIQESAQNIISNQNGYNGVTQAAFSRYSSRLSAVTVQNATIISRLDNMQPQVITQSLSFFLGAIVAIAFVLAARTRM